MNLGDLRTSRSLKKEDVGVGVLVTISGITQENVAMDGAEPDMRACLHFRELDKPLVLKSTIGQIIAKIAGTEDDIEHTWVGVRVVLYNDPNVMFKNQIVGGIRVRAPKPGAAVAPAPAPVQAPVAAPAPVQAPVQAPGPYSEADLPF